MIITTEEGDIQEEDSGAYLPDVNGNERKWQQSRNLVLTFFLEENKR